MPGYYDTIVRYKGTFDYHGLYALMKNFFTSRDYDWYETRYKDKGNEAESDWTAEREYDEYHKIVFSITFHLWDYEKLEVQQHGERKTLVSGRIQITIGVKTVYDYNEVPVYGKDRFNQFLKKVQDKYVRQREADEKWDVLTLSMQYDLVGKIKQFLGMEDK